MMREQTWRKNILWKGYVLVNPGLEEVAQQEVFELIRKKGNIFHSVVEFTSEEKESFLVLLQRLQSARRLLMALGSYNSIDRFAPEKVAFPWQEIFLPQLSFKVEVENVDGEQNRLRLSKEIAEKITGFIKKKYSVVPQVDLSRPDICVVGHWNGEQFFLGIDCYRKELNARHYRVFAHAASFKGDVGYLCVRAIGFKPENSLLVGFAHDGTIVIEAALFANKMPVNALKYSSAAFEKFAFKGSASALEHRGKNKGYSKEGYSEENKHSEIPIIQGFDENLQSIIAAKRNASIAEVREKVFFQKCFLDELDVLYNEGQFDAIIFQVTSKNEAKINEIYYQAVRLLKPKGKILLISREKWELPVSEKFKLANKMHVRRGNNAIILWLLEKNHKSA